MARTQRELTGDSPAIRFANRLRHARQAADLTLRRLSEISGYSLGTLSTAESGRKVPTWDVTEAFVQACRQQDIGRWRGWWEAERDRELNESQPIETPEPTPPPAQTPNRPTTQRPIRWWLVPVTAVLSALLTFITTLLIQTTTVPAATQPTGPDCLLLESPITPQGQVIGHWEKLYISACDIGYQTNLPPGSPSSMRLKTPIGAGDVTP